MALVALIGLILGGRAAHLSFADGGNYQAFAAERGSEVAPDAASGRGDIISGDGRILATSLEAARVVATPYQIEDPERTARALAGMIDPSAGLSVLEIRDRLVKRDKDGNPGGYSVIGPVDRAIAEKVRNLEIEGIYVVPSAVRTYPDGSLASQLTGYLGEYGEAFGGIEARYDERLEGGRDVQLTMDTAVQRELENALGAAVDEHDASSALGLVMRVDDGAIVALANSPTYDNNRFNQVRPGLQRNRVLTDPYEPGSTFKPFTLAAALETGTVTGSSVYTVPDSMPVADRVIHDSQPHETKVMSPQEILQESSNVGTIQIAQDLGGRRLENYVDRFGFGGVTGIDLWGEDAGTVPAYEKWSGSSIGNIPIGQGLTVTPLQLASGYATLANGGTVISPHVTQKQTPPAPGPRVISEETSDIVGEMLQSVVEEGTGRLARIPGYTVAGKTGTSQKVDPETGTYGDSYVASFVGFAPATDPEYVTLVVVDEPQGSIWGEQVAAPAFQKVMSFTLKYFNVPPDRRASQRGSAQAGTS